jgi:hypothetical protein
MHPDAPARTKVAAKPAPMAAEQLAVTQAADLAPMTDLVLWPLKVAAHELPVHKAEAVLQERAIPHLALQHPPMPHLRPTRQHRMAAAVDRTAAAVDRTAAAVDRTAAADPMAAARHTTAN